jgi:hypothetical protein
VPGQFRLRPISAIAVDNEPKPFWTGDDEEYQIRDWCSKVAFRPAWGKVAKCGVLNGSSGRWLDENVLKPLGVSRSEAWITDCLDTYFESAKLSSLSASPAVRNAIARASITPARHRPELSANEIVREALAYHIDRLREEFHTARPDLVVTLGNAAFRVMDALAGGKLNLQNLSLDIQSYGQPLRARIGDKSVDWIPLAHPKSPLPYRRTHAAWVGARKESDQLGVAVAAA